MDIGVVVDFVIVFFFYVFIFFCFVIIMDVFFLFCDIEYYLKIMESGIFGCVEDVVSECVDVLILGYGGGEKCYLVGWKFICNL